MNTEKEITVPVQARPACVRTGQHTLKMFLLSYVPNVVKDESVNIGLIVVGDGIAEIRFATDWKRVLALDPDADIELLTALTLEIRAKLQTPGQPEEMLRNMEESWSNAVQLSPGKGYVTDDPAKEIGILASQYL
jgi:hypothetical protein